MKTATHTSRLGITIQIAILLLLMLALITNAKGAHITIADIPMPAAENEVKDIPFDTHEVAIEYFFDKATSGIEIRQETEINDIPFSIAMLKYLNPALYAGTESGMAPEPMVNDIPFDTREVVQEHRFDLLGETMALIAECSINDIPFEAVAILAGIDQQRNSPAKLSLMKNLPDHVMNRFVNLIKASLISLLILASAGILGFLFFSYVY